MYVHTEGYSFANILYSVQGYALPRPQRLLPLVVSLLVGATLAIRFVAPVFGSLAGLVVFGAIVWYLPRLVEELESYCGRNPLVELFYLTRHLIGVVGGGTLFVGARRTTGPERRRMAALFASERELAGVDGYKGRHGRLVGSLSKLGRTVFRILVRTAHPTGRRTRDNGDFDSRTDTRTDTRTDLGMVRRDTMVNR